MTGSRCVPAKQNAALVRVASRGENSTTRGHLLSALPPTVRSCNSNNAAQVATAQRLVRQVNTLRIGGLKSMLYAGVTADDPRVKAATRWLQANYSVDENPGLGSAGLYYYYHLMAKALDAVGAPTFEDASGKQHDWRAELAAALLARQAANGSWVNENNRWLEGDPNLATSFALLALAYCRGEK